MTTTPTHQFTHALSPQQTIALASLVTPKEVRDAKDSVAAGHYGAMDPILITVNEMTLAESTTRNESLNYRRLANMALSMLSEASLLKVARQYNDGDNVKLARVDTHCVDHIKLKKGSAKRYGKASTRAIATVVTASMYNTENTEGGAA
jgi:purine-nucleoside phosphorylase